VVTIRIDVSVIVLDVPTYPVPSCLGDIFSDLLWGETERTNFGCQSGGGSNLTTGGSEMAVLKSVSSYRAANRGFLELRRGSSTIGPRFTHITLISFGSIFGAVEICVSEVVLVDGWATYASCNPNDELYGCVKESCRKLFTFNLPLWARFRLASGS
jgi:hypothetical protein